MRVLRPVCLLVCLAVCDSAFTAPLAPNDASIAGSLISWLRDAGSNYAAGVWQATVGPDAGEVGEAGDGDIYELPVLEMVSPGDGYFSGVSDISGVLFSADESDLLRADEINGGGEMDELTLIAVYQTSGNTDRTRPVGIASRTEDMPVLGNAFHLSSDASLRYDNGNNQTDPANHPDELLVRAAKLIDSEVSDFLNDELLQEDTPVGGNFSGIIRNDDLYMGDVRGGLLDGFAGTDPHDIFVAEVIVYNTALSENQMIGIGEWLRDNVNQSLSDGPTRLQAGDADEDLDFDQLDLVRVQIAAKYLSGDAATWGDGDWNGAPGGEPGSPPAGNGLFDQLDIISALGNGLYLTGSYGALATGGVERDGQTSVIYDPTNGSVSVDAPAGVELTSINIDSAAGIFTGTEAQNLGGSFDNDADANIFKATFGGSFGSLSFGRVAQTGLTQEFVLNDLTVVGSLSAGGDLGAVDLVYVPEPTAATLLLLGGGLLSALRRRSAITSPSGARG